MQFCSILYTERGLGEKLEDVSGAGLRERAAMGTPFPLPYKDILMWPFGGRTPTVL